MVIFLCFCILDPAGYQGSTATDATSEDSRSVRRGPQSDHSGASNETKATSNSSVVDLKMELALEMRKFIEEIEYKLDHVVPMAELCFVGDVVECWVWSLVTFTRYCSVHSLLESQRSGLPTAVV